MYSSNNTATTESKAKPKPSLSLFLPFINVHAPSHFILREFCRSTNGPPQATRANRFDPTIPV